MGAKASGEQVVQASAAEVFAVVDDWTRTTDYMRGLKRWEPAGEQTHGVGARFAVAMDAGPKTLDSTVEIVERDEDRRIAWVPVDGVRQSGAWTFEPIDDARCRARLDTEFELGGGLAGRALAKAAEPVIRRHVGQSVEGLKRLVEGG